MYDVSPRVLGTVRPIFDFFWENGEKEGGMYSIGKGNERLLCNFLFWLPSSRS